MKRAVFLKSVRDDLISILEFIAAQSGGVSTAERFVQELRAKCRALAALESEIGRSRLELGPEIRSFPDKGYVIFFRYLGERFEVVNFVERHRDIDTLFDRNNR